MPKTIKSYTIEELGNEHPEIIIKLNDGIELGVKKTAEGGELVMYFGGTITHDGMMSYEVRHKDYGYVYISMTERIDEFARKRYSDPAVHIYRTVIVRGKKLSEQGNEIQVKLEGNGSFEREGETYVFNKGNLLDGKPEDVQLGVWVTKGTPQKI